MESVCGQRRVITSHGAWLRLAILYGRPTDREAAAALGCGGVRDKFMNTAKHSPVGPRAFVAITSPLERY